MKINVMVNGEIFLKQVEIDKLNKKQLEKDMKKYIELNSKNSCDYYKLRRDAIKKKYQEENKNITLEEIKLDKERVSNRIESSNPSYVAMMIAIISTFFNMFIPNIAESISKNLVTDKFVSSTKTTIIILYSLVVFITLFIVICKQLEEIRILKVLKNVIDEVEMEKINELINNDDKNDMSEIKKQISDIKIFLGI